MQRIWGQALRCNNLGVQPSSPVAKDPRPALSPAAPSNARITREALTGKLDKHRAWLGSDPAGRRLDLTGADLIGLLLSGAILAHADLRGADLQFAQVRCADLRCADLRGADLRAARLDQTDLRGADLRDTDLRDADLRGAPLRGADLRGARTDGARGLPRRLRPDGGPSPLTRNSGACSGETVFRGTQVPVATLFQRLDDDLPLDVFLQMFPAVSREQARAVLRRAARHVERYPEEDAQRGSPPVEPETAVRRGTRVPVTKLFSHLDESSALDGFLARFPAVSREQARAILRRASRWVERHPGQDTEQRESTPLSRDPRVHSGSTVFSGTRVPATSLFEHLSADYSLRQFLAARPTVSHAQASAVLRRAARYLRRSPE